MNKRNLVAVLAAFLSALVLTGTFTATTAHAEEVSSKTLRVTIAAAGTVTVTNPSQVTVTDCRVYRDRLDAPATLGSVATIGPGYSGTFQLDVPPTDGLGVYVQCLPPGGTRRVTVGSATYHAPTPPAPHKVTLKVQVDKYSTATSKLRSKAASYDNDGLLNRSEDRPHWGKSVWEIVTVTGTVNTTKAQWLAKINAATKKLPDLKSGKRWSVAAIKAAGLKSITQAWVISGDGKPTAWHAGHTKTGVAQRHFASNR